jgi:alpha-L-rhamnosidase
LSTALTSASARHLTPYGEAGVAWEIDGDLFHLAVRVPVGVTAHVYLPGNATAELVGHGNHSWDVPLPSDAPALVPSLTD